MEKKQSIRSVFKNVFKEEMLLDQFVFCSKLGMFIKVVNDELIQYIALDNLGIYDKGKYSFRIMAGCISVYIDQLTKGHLMMYGTMISSYACDIFDTMMADRYIYDENTMNDKMEEALADTKKYALSTMDKCHDVQSYVSMYRLVGICNLRFALRRCGDSLAMIMADDHNDFIELFNKVFSSSKEQPYFMPEYEQQLYDTCYNGMVEMTAGERDKVYNDPELYAAALKECEIRKERNLQTLRELKVIK